MRCRDCTDQQQLNNTGPLSGVCLHLSLLILILYRFSDSVCVCSSSLDVILAQIVCVGNPASVCDVWTRPPVCAALDVRTGCVQDARYVSYSL